MLLNPKPLRKWLVFAKENPPKFFWAENRWWTLVLSEKMYWIRAAYNADSSDEMFYYFLQVEDAAGTRQLLRFSGNPTVEPYHDAETVGVRVVEAR